MTFDELEDWAMGQAPVGTTITEVQATVQKLLVEYESTMNELDYCTDANYELSDALERGCD